MNNFLQKILSVIIGTVATYFGFQALDLISGAYQISTYFTVSWYIFAFHIFWLSFLYDLHLKHRGHLSHARSRFAGAKAILYAFQSRVRHFYHWTYVRHYLNYLILPAIMYWSVVFLMYLNPFHELFKDALIIVATTALGVVYWYLKQAFSHHMELHSSGLKVLALAKLLGAYLAFTALLALGWYYGLSRSVLLPAVFIISFLLVYQALFQHRLLKIHMYPSIMLFALAVTVIFGAVYQYWGINYYIAGVLVVVFYNTFWGILHKYLEKTLTSRVLIEYVFMLVVLASLILATQNNYGRI